MSDVIVNISYCQAHRKRPRNDRLDGRLHAIWLEQCVNHVLAAGLPVVVSATCWPGLCAVEPAQREVLWRIIDYVGFMTMPELSHQEGAAWNIFQGLDFATHHGQRYMIHTAEDVIVSHESLHQIADLLRQGNVYVGSNWDGVVHERAIHGLNSQFFGCNVHCLYDHFDTSRIVGTLEESLRAAVGEGRKYLYPVEGPAGYERHGPYEHTHDYGEWLSLMRKVGAKL